MEDMSSTKTSQQKKNLHFPCCEGTVSLLGQYEKEEKPSQVEYTSARDYLLTTICMYNGSRSGMLDNDSSSLELRLKKTGALS